MSPYVLHGTTYKGATALTLHLTNSTHSFVYMPFLRVGRQRSFAASQYPNFQEQHPPSFLCWLLLGT